MGAPKGCGPYGTPTSQQSITPPLDSMWLRLWLRQVLRTTLGLRPSLLRSLVLRTSRISTSYGQLNKTNLSEVMSKREILNRNALGQFAPNKQTITLNAIQKEVIVGTLLGDASMPLYRGKPKLHVEFQQTIARGLYIWHLY